MSEFIFKPFSKEQLDQLDCIIRAMKAQNGIYIRNEELAVEQGQALEAAQTKLQEAAVSGDFNAVNDYNKAAQVAQKKVCDAKDKMIDAESIIQKRMLELLNEDWLLTPETQEAQAQEQTIQGEAA